MRHTREDVIKGLECCMSEKTCHGHCPYNGECEDGGYFYSKAIEDAIALLKAQTARVMTLSEMNDKHKDLIHGRKSTHDDLVAGWNRRAEETPPQGWISVEDSMPPEHETIFAKLYGTDKWRNTMFRKMSDDVRVVKIFNDGTKRVHHDHTVDGVWESERKGTAVYGYVTHWMQNPELPKVIEWAKRGKDRGR